MAMNMGAQSVNTNTKWINFEDGSIQKTAYTLQVPPNIGVVPVTGTSGAVTFSTPFAVQPVVVVTPYTQAPPFWVTFQGSVGNYTGFTVNVASTFFGAFNYVVFGNPD